MLGAAGSPAAGWPPLQGSSQAQVLGTHTPSHQHSGGESVGSLRGTEGPFSPPPLLYLPSSRTVVGPAGDCVLAAHSALQKNVPTHTLHVGDS